MSDCLVGLHLGQVYVRGRFYFCEMDSVGALLFSDAFGEREMSFDYLL